MGLLAATPLLLDLIITLLEEQNLSISDTQKEAIKRGILLGPAPAIIFKKLTELELTDITKALKVFT